MEWPERLTPAETRLRQKATQRAESCSNSVEQLRRNRITRLPPAKMRSVSSPSSPSEPHRAHPNLTEDGSRCPLISAGRVLGNHHPSRGSPPGAKESRRWDSVPGFAPMGAAEGAYSVSSHFSS